MVAETLMVAWRRRDAVPAGAEAIPWLYGVAWRLLANQRRGRSRRLRLQRALEPLTAPLPDTAVAAERRDAARAHEDAHREP